MKVLGKVAETATIASRELEEQREALAATATRLVEGTCKYVAAHPLQSLGLAVLAGYMIGRLTARLTR